MDDLNDSLVKAGQQLNLKSHTVQLNRGRRIAIATPITLEAYQQSCGYYLGCMATLLPLDSAYEGILLSDSESGASSKNLGSSSTSQYQALEKEGYHTTLCNRLRPEFVIVYNQSLSSNALTSHSSALRNEKQLNDLEAIKASKYLRENWIPSFVQRLDQMELRPIDSYTLTTEMHRNGVNVRYLGTFFALGNLTNLGLIAKLSTLPHIRNLACIEMIARAAKLVFHARLRSAILHFRSVGATQIDAEMKSYATLTFSTILGKGDRNQRYFEEKIRDMIQLKFNYTMDYNNYSNLHRPALFGALQYHVIRIIRGQCSFR